MRQKLTKQEIRTLISIESRLCRMADKMDENDLSMATNVHDMRVMGHGDICIDKNPEV